MTSQRRTLVERYALAPQDIETLSLERVRAATAHLQLADPERTLVERMVYAAGDPALADAVRLHPLAVTAGVAALQAGHAVVADVRMVAVALDAPRLLRLGVPICCAIDAPMVVEAARSAGLPRAVMAIRSLAHALQGGIAVVGNAPTALLALLDLVDAGEARPALIVGTPVGFVAATEAKEELMVRDVPFVTVAGTRGGSAVGAAALNALARIALHP